MSDVNTKTALATLKEGSAGELLLAGQLDYRNGKHLCELGESIINNSSASSFTLDCSGVTRTSSVGLSLVLSLIRDAKKQAKPLMIKTFTEDLDEIAKFSGLIEILPLADDFKVVNVN
ncbi:STAS domain-containing protein [Entomomonas asaccharolytica]|uniref:STAS domain-containing protein n=1 Tax=Entomomonas asaccharolytica TaxID=2785331 RepID=A0A974RXR9_9GAMM|nr:STAS domain-containing protein [Entomomonas asaccharolytica]QQP86538.1 STAS domain-containing protein [Entomomonas asaccharolytica]